MKKYLFMPVMLILVAYLLILFLVLFVQASNDFQCIFIENTTCPSGTARLIGVTNDTDGYNNAHVQNNTYATYNYSVCCNSTNSSINITAGCPGNVTVLKLSNGTNSHVEIGTNSNYSSSVCFSSTWQVVNCEFPAGSCSAGFACVLGMASSEGANTSNAHVANCSEYNQKVCCGLSNRAPPRPTLYYPANGNSSVFERRPNFNWSVSIDPEGNSVDYILNATAATPSCNVYVGSISTTNYTATSALCVDIGYNWTVTACDTYDACNTSTIFNFTIASVANLELIHNATSFGTMAIKENNDTTDDSPEPLVARNTGNVLLNVTLNATALFNSVNMNTIYYQFKADYNESGSYVGSCSQDASFADMNTSDKIIFCNMSYKDTGDEGEIELNITIPADESPGTKTSIIRVSYSSVE